MRFPEILNMPKSFSGPMVGILGQRPHAMTSRLHIGVCPVQQALKALVLHEMLRTHSSENFVPESSGDNLYHSKIRIIPAVYKNNVASA
ncbi:hypothetical protein BWQ96_02400 [Gracilariopsis chorda]|uniref:Uncharacterized protein n=1 Tax=Gracilariopsis chorda TaxID=448386 RepID=A0A2V3J004_9FLOR|nr:hypothetical protein BWQ96_02400 [Gracilariopsis chorda]|eukprot:PXF47718.1 hypothetical protein BWQ96_02400 [Gracilariopsis chorda]